MSDAISREQAGAVLTRMGYDIVAEFNGRAVYLDRNYPGDPIHCLVLDFSYGPIPWEVVLETLDYDGANADVFRAELESL